MVSTVSSPDVSKDTLKTNLRTAYDLGETDTNNDNNFIMRQHFEYGFTDIYSARLQFIQNKRQHGQWEHNSVSFQNRIELFDEKRDGWGGTIRASYKYRNGSDRHDTVRTSFLYLLPDAIMGAEFRQNILLSYDVDKSLHEGLKVEFRSQVTTKLFEDSSIRIGAEMMNIFPSFSNQNLAQNDIHQIGPVLKAKLTDKVSMQTGYRFTTDGKTETHGVMLYLGQKFTIK